MAETLIETELLRSYLIVGAYCSRLAWSAF